MLLLGAWTEIVAGQAALFGLTVPVFPMRADDMQAAAVNRL
jgi:hypothetical protein